MTLVYVRDDKIKDSKVSTLETSQNQAVHLMPTLPLPILLLYTFLLPPSTSPPLSFTFVSPFSVT